MESKNNQNKIFPKENYIIPEIIDKNDTSIPLLQLNSITVFPCTFVTIDVDKESSKNSILASTSSLKEIFLVTKKNHKNKVNSNKDLHLLYDIGVKCKILTCKESDNSYKLELYCIHAAKILELVNKRNYISCKFTEISYPVTKDSVKEKAYISMLKSIGADNFNVNFDEYFNIGAKVVSNFYNFKNSHTYLNILITESNFSKEEKNKLLKNKSALDRITCFLELLEMQNINHNIEKEVMEKVKKSMNEAQRNYMLREKLKVVQEELGDSTSINAYLEECRKKLAEILPPDYVVEKIENEFSRLESLPPNSQEIGNIKDYIDRTLSIPWGNHQVTKVNNNIKNAEKTLNSDHFGLVKVKERILEHLAVEQFSNEHIPTIICLVGPPGVGKTSIAKSIAKATNRNYVRLSLGGIRDETEIRGHRRTYLSSTHGRIISSLIKAKSNNPLILFDEIDKMSSDFRGDPSSAMLEVLDPEQNIAFRDTYLELDFDLSNCLFVCTANNQSKIPAPLLDRMEIINLNTYTLEEKRNIAKSFLIPKLLKKHNLTNKDLSIPLTAITTIVENYTLEAGVRNLEKSIGKICRKVVLEKLTNENFTKVSINKNNIVNYLGAKRELKTINIKTKTVGVVNGLAYTSYGGTVLPMEFAIFNGNGKIDFTGNIGKVMGESARISMAYLKSNAKTFGFQKIDFSKIDVSIHVPEGATPKDGPSAGLAITMGLYSILSNSKVNANIAMTGEISMKGNVLPIGGLKEKILAGKNYGIHKFLIPSKNKSHFYDLEDYITKDIEVVFVSKVTEALPHCFDERKKNESK
ncbi:MAG: endopeptidase La [Lachnospirales bacterium]